ncbi:MAG: OmpA family protein [Pseudomonadota bacterium]
MPRAVADSSFLIAMMVKRRFLIGSVLSAMAIGGALALDQIGPVAPPDPLTVQFSRGASLALGEEERLAAFAGAHIAEARIQFHVLGHTGDRGDRDANLTLSQERADAVAAALEAAGIEKDRIQVVKGVGSADPLAAALDESDSGLQRRMARAVVTAVVRK